MNLLIPDSWIRQYLKTQATPKQIKEYLSLCGPSIERINKIGKEIVYEVEITTNRTDSMSVVGIAREAAAILPRFGIETTVTEDPYQINLTPFIRKYKQEKSKKLIITTNEMLNPRFTAIVIDKVKIASSPAWLKKYLELSGVRSINNVVDVTNFIMKAYGQPAHVFDYQKIGRNKNNIAVMTLRASKKGENITTLDGKTFVLPGNDIVIEDGEGKLIDLCGVMGAANSHISDNTSTIVLFLQTYNPLYIRRTAMHLAHRTEAAALFEKGLDSELVMPAMEKSVRLILDLTKGKISSKLYDIYPKTYQAYQLEVNRDKIDIYLGLHLSDDQIKEILASLYLKPEISAEKIIVTIPSFRRDLEIDVDIIEEIARIYGFHNILPMLPSNPPPITVTEPVFNWESEIKLRLRDWGFTEILTYSMISEKYMDQYNLDKTKTYKIKNPLSDEWVYMRPDLLPGMLQTVKQNLNLSKDARFFELSMVYKFREGNLPEEELVLLAAYVGNKFFDAKGLSESIFQLFGIAYPTYTDEKPLINYFDQNLHYQLGEYGYVAQISQEFLTKLGVKSPVTILELNFTHLVQNAHPIKKYQEISKYPLIVEDLSFILPPHTPVAWVLDKIQLVSKYIYSAELLNQFENTSTFRIRYLNKLKPLTSNEVGEIRKEIIVQITKNFSAQLKGSDQNF